MAENFPEVTEDLGVTDDLRIRALHIQGSGVQHASDTVTDCGFDNETIACGEANNTDDGLYVPQLQAALAILASAEEER